MTDFDVAKAVHTHVANDITDATAAGKAMLQAASAAAQTALLTAGTTTAKGTAQLATNAQVIAGTATSIVVTPAGIMALIEALGLASVVVSTTSWPARPIAALRVIWVDAGGLGTEPADAIDADLLVAAS